MKIITSSRIGDIDQYTIQHEPVPSVSLMERASVQIFRWIRQNLPYRTFWVFAGPGNNGGDALAVARLLIDDGFGIKVWLYDQDKTSPDAKRNLERLNIHKNTTITNLACSPLPDEIPKNTVVIDGLFGSGLSRPLNEKAAAIVQQINRYHSTVISVDVPSGLFCEENSHNAPKNIIKATVTLTLQTPKLAFFFPANHAFVGRWVTLPIGLSPHAISRAATSWTMLEEAEIRRRMPARGCFDHKGTMGHALLIAGSNGKMGAAILGSRACLRSGVGLLTTHVPREALPVIQSSVPEAMTHCDRSDLMFTQIPDLQTFSAIGVGPGLGTGQNTRRAMKELIETAKNKPMVIDADGLNILGLHPDYLELLPPSTILTPHPGEFRRLVGEWNSDYERLQKAIDFAARYNVILILKGAWTMITEPGGQVFFNPTGNPGMATAGSGDALTGVILALLARGMPPLNAALTGVYVHGLAGDLSAEKLGYEGVTASGIIHELGGAFKKIGT